MPAPNQGKPLWLAARDANLAQLTALLDQGANPNSPWHGYSPLHTLTQASGHKPTTVTPQILACIQLLLRRGTDPLQRGGFPPTSVMHLAAFAGAPEIIDLLRKANVRAETPHPTQPDRYGLTALHYLAGSRLTDAKRAKSAEKLLAAGADPNAETKAGTHTITPIYLAGNAGNLDIFALLLRHGANPDLALTTAMWSTRPFISYAQLALQHGAAPDRATADGKPLLNSVIQWGRMQQAHWLLAHGASPNLPDKDGWTALHQAVSRGNRKVIDALLAHGAERNRKDKLGHTPAGVARITGRPQLAATLDSGPFQKVSHKPKK